MLSEHLPNLTERITGYFDGVLPIGSMMQWSQAILNGSPTVGTYVLDSPLDITINIQYETSADTMSASQKKRIFISYLILNHVPDKGLDELLKTVGEIIEFYSFRSVTPVSQMIDAPQSPQIQARLKDPSIRPEFPISEDEV